MQQELFTVWGMYHEDTTNLSHRPAGALLAVMLSSALVCRADEVYTGGVTVDIDYEILGYLWIEEATVNLYPGAHIVNDYYMGDVFAASGAVLNIHGGQIDSMLIITTAMDELPDAMVTVYGTEFAVDGVPVDPEAAELFLANQILSGRYEDGSEFAFRVDCYYETAFFLTLRLNWVDAGPPEPDPEPDIRVSLPEVNFGQVEVDAFREILVTASNAGTAPLTIYSLALEQEPALQFYTTALAQFPLSLDPNQTAEIGLLFAPAIEGQTAGTLVLLSDDPDEERLEIALAGEGFIRLTPAEQIAVILEFFQESIDNGTLQGVGRGPFADWNLQALRHTLWTAHYLIGRDQYNGAAQMLKLVQMKTDSRWRPGDWATGSATAELNEKVSALIEDLKTR